MAWEQKIATYLGRKMDQMINGEISGDRPFGSTGNVAQITNSATGVNSGSFSHWCWWHKLYCRRIVLVTIFPSRYIELWPQHLNIVINIDVVINTDVKTSNRILDWLLFYVGSSIGCMETNWWLRSRISRWPCWFKQHVVVGIDSFSTFVILLKKFCAST